MGRFIDYDDLKHRLKIKDILPFLQTHPYLSAFKVDPRNSNLLRGNCPFKHHPGDRNSKSFVLDLAGDGYICPSHCGKGFGVLDFYADIVGTDRNNPLEINRIAALLYDKFLANMGATTSSTELSTPVLPKPPQAHTQKPLENKPINFNLSFERDIPVHFLSEKKLTSDTIQYFESGIATHGKLKGRLAVTVHNSSGEKIGYAGQSLETGDWLFYFNKSSVLFNYHRVKRLTSVYATQPLLVVESFYSVMFLHQHGIKKVVALMGKTASEKQIERIQELTDKAYLLLDNDEAGRKGTEILQNQFPLGFITPLPFTRLEQHTKPRHLSLEMLQVLRYFNS